MANTGQIMRSLLESQWVKASGYLSIFLLPALFLAGSLLQLPWLAVATVLLIFPLTRLVFGPLPAGGPPDWTEAVATALHRLPLAYAPIFTACVIGGLHATMEQVQAAGQHQWIAIGLSLWMTMLFATCVAHELIHRREQTHATLGQLVAGMAGYPLLGLEHLKHHGRLATGRRTEVPSITDSMWTFAARRMAYVGKGFLECLARLPHPICKPPSSLRTILPVGTTALTTLAFAAIGGWQAAVTYACASIGVAFGVQLITYLQHWGLSASEGHDKHTAHRAWEGDCQFQAWVTLSISLHDAHHREPAKPYYRLKLSQDAPRAPAGYLVLMFVSMAPTAWRKLMFPALAHWRSEPSHPISAGRKLVCFGHVHGAFKTRAAPQQPD